MLLSICNNVDILRIIQIIRTAVTIIKIAVPILLILSCMFEGVKAISSNDTEITSKMLKSWQTKAIAAILVFFIPTFINILANLGDADNNAIKACFANSTSEKIDEFQVELAEKHLKQLKTSLSSPDYSTAKREINRVKNEAEKTRLNSELKILEDYINLRKRIASLSKRCDSKKLRELKTEIEATTDAELKERLLKELDELKCKDLGWWWPVGSSTTTESGGVKFAEGPPVTTTITAYFGGNDSVHKGSHGAIDIGSSHDPIIASKSGTVIYPGPNDRIDYPDQHIKSIAEDCPGLKANYVIIQHEDGWTTQYSHLYQNTITVRKGDHVDQGQVIGISGSSGCSTGDHLHFQMELNGSRVDPLDYVDPKNPRP